MREGAVVGGAVADEGVAAVIGDVEPLVAVGGPGVGLLDPAEEMAVTIGGVEPETEGAVDVDPGVELVCERDEAGVVVKRADV